MLQSNQKLLEADWADMDYILPFHSTTRLFVGPPPDNPADYFKRFAIATGVGAITFASNRRGVGIERPSDRKVRTLRSSFPIHDILSSRYCGGINGQPNFHTNLTARNIEDLVNSVLARSPDLQIIRDFGIEFAQTKKYRAANLLTLLDAGVNQESDHLNFDYLSMAIRCHNMLNHIREHFISNADRIAEMKLDRKGWQQWQIPDNDITSLQDYNDPSISGYMRTSIFPSHHMATGVAKSVFLSDPDAAALALNMSLEAMGRSQSLRFGGVSLKETGRMMGDFIAQEGDKGLKEKDAMKTRKVDIHES